MNPVTITQSDGPVVLAIPHTGTEVDQAARSRLNEEGRALRDTDWHIHKLYSGLLPGATTVRATFHRYLIDANRDPTGESLYPGQNTTELCPTTNFDGVPLYDKGQEPGSAEIARRLREYHAVYHRSLANELARVKRIHGHVILYDCHSIRSHIPHLFDGVLPDFNIGTNSSSSCAPVIEDVVAEICTRAEGYTSIVNGRFKGGWTTRHYGNPEQGVHAIQMELAQSTHLASEDLPFDYDSKKAAELRVHLKAILQQLNDLALSGALAGH